MITHNITLDVCKRLSQIPPQIVVRQGETATQKIVATILNDGVEYTSSCSSVRLDILHSDDTWAEVAATKSGSTVTCTLPSDALNSHGLCKLCHFVFFTGSKTVETTQGIELRILPAVEPKGAESKAADYENIFADLYEKWAALEKTAESQEAARVSAEKSRVSAENARVTAEKARVSAETARDTAEKERVANEKVRVTQENERVEAEKNRKSTFTTLETNCTSATTAANTAATNANTATTKANNAATSATSAVSSMTSTYLTKTDASSTYLTKTNASSTYLTKTDASSTYLTKTNASSTYTKKWKQLWSGNTTSNITGLSDMSAFSFIEVFYCKGGDGNTSDHLAMGSVRFKPSTFPYYVSMSAINLYPKSSTAGTMQYLACYITVNKTSITRTAGAFVNFTYPTVASTASAESMMAITRIVGWY